MRTASLRQHLAEIRMKEDALDAPAPGRKLFAFGSEEHMEIIEKAKAEAREEAAREEAARAALQAEEYERTAIERIESEKKVWLNDLAVNISEQISQGLCEIESEFSTLLTELLTPIIEEKNRENVVSAFLQCLNNLLKDKNCLSIAVEGPEDILGALREADFLKDKMIEFTANKSDEIRARIERTLVRARLTPILQNSTDPQDSLGVDSSLSGAE